MNASPAPRRLDHRSLVVLDGLREQELVCLEGSLWVTLDHQPQDIVLGPGQRLAGVPQRVVVYALQASRYVVRRDCSASASTELAAGPTAVCA